MAFLLLTKGLCFEETKTWGLCLCSTKTKVFGFAVRTTKTKTLRCSLFNENFPAEKAYRLLESILASKYSGHELFIDRTQESFPIQNAFFIILSRNPNYRSNGASVRILPAVPE